LARTFLLAPPPPPSVLCPLFGSLFSGIPPSNFSWEGDHTARFKFFAMDPDFFPSYSFPRLLSHTRPCFPNHCFPFPLPLSGEVLGMLVIAAHHPSSPIRRNVASSALLGTRWETSSLWIHNRFSAPYYPPVLSPRFVWPLHFSQSADVVLVSPIEISTFPAGFTCPVPLGDPSFCVLLPFPLFYVPQSPLYYFTGLFMVPVRQWYALIKFWSPATFGGGRSKKRLAFLDLWSFAPFLPFCRPSSRYV